MTHLRLNLLALALSSVAFCQAPLPQNVLKVAPASAVTAKAGATVTVALSLQVDTGYHVNSNTPADPFLIPLTLTWNPGVLESSGVVFPKPQNQKYPFSKKPVSVFTGNFEIVARFKVAAGAGVGSNVVTGKLHYQACDDRACLPPKTIEVSVPVEIPPEPIWIDPNTGLTWPTADNGSGVSLSQAVYYCSNLTLAGYKDWTLPAIDDLQRLFGGPADENGHHVLGAIKLTGWAWSSTPGNEPGEEWSLDFGDGGRASVVNGDSGLNRALCVRSVKK
jgi:hypothetical protein